MATHDLSVVCPDPITHAHQLIDLCAKTFGGFYDFRRQLREWYLLNSHYDWAASAVGFVDGQLVTHYGVWDYQMRIGKSVVRCGGIGAVATDGEFRKKGLMARTVPHSLAAMKSRGYDLSILFGVWDFYHRFGYVRAWNETNWSIARDRLPKELPTVRYEEIKAIPDDQIARLHNRANAEVTGAAVRPTFSRAHCFFKGTAECFIWRSGRRMVGHVMVQMNNGRLVCYEATGRPEDILSVLAGLAAKKGSRDIGFETLPYDSPLARRLRQFTVRSERQYIKSGGAMVRLLNLTSCLGKMTTELSDRIATSEMAGYSGSLSIRYARETATLKIRRGRVSLDGAAASRNTLRGGYEIAQLIMGTDDPMEVCEGGEMRLSGDASRLVKVLFPNEHPQLHQADRY